MPHLSLVLCSIINSHAQIVQQCFYLNCSKLNAAQSCQQARVHKYPDSVSFGTFLTNKVDDDQQAFIRSRSQATKDSTMMINMVWIQPIVALLAGVLILVVPRLLNYIVAVYLIIVGIAGLFPHLQ
jgi:hypothetical protein